MNDADRLSARFADLSKGCMFCNRGAGILETHHLIPRRYGGTDDPENIVQICPTCHRILERLYNNALWERLGVNELVADRREKANMLVDFLGSFRDEEARYTAKVERDRFKAQRRAMAKVLRKYSLEDMVCLECETVTEFEYIDGERRCVVCNAPHQEAELTA